MTALFLCLGGIISLLVDSAIAARWKFVSGKIVIVKMHQNGQSHRFFQSLLAIDVQREGGIGQLLSYLVAKIFLFLLGHGSNMKFCKWQDEKWRNWIKN